MLSWTSALVAACIVALQTGTVLWQHYASHSVPLFWLSHAVRHEPTWQAALSAIHGADSFNSSFSGRDLIPKNDSGLLACLRTTAPRAHCLQTDPPPFVAVKVMEPWDPRVLLLVLACLHLHMIGVARFISLFLVILSVVVGIIGRIQWPTIVSCIAAVLAGILRPQDTRWLVSAHLQFVAVPLGVLGIALAGDRMWTNAVAHAALLSAAVNCLCMQARHRSQTLGLYRALTILLTLIPIRIATDSLGAHDTWRYMVAYAGCAGLAPLVFLSLMPQEKDPGDDREMLAYYYNNEDRLLFFIVPLASKTLAYQQVLLQVCISLALLGLSTSLTFFARF